MRKNLEHIKSELISNAIFFLENMGYFHSFGLELLMNNEIVLHGVEESDLEILPDNEKILNRITQKLLNSIENNKSQTIGVAINSHFKKDGFQEVSCIEIRVLDSSKEEFQTYLRYFLNDNVVEIFDELKNPWIELK